ncbi:MAG: 5'/3'-nucleotidase SurE [Chloroflexi bacterium]|nr:5'/3'-nucleotidase SurE [Chloroflexota bacterium]
MLILVTNDDGIASEGLAQLRQAISEIAETVVIAPDHNWSGAGHCKTLRRPLRVWETRLADGSQGFATEGTPTDCVALGLLGLTGHRPEFVVSGINKGPNLGYDITYSGTVAAAIEAAISGVPSVAVSIDSHSGGDLHFTAHFSAILVKKAIRKGLDPSAFLNVNMPGIPRESIRGVEITRLGRRIYRDILVGRTEPNGDTYYCIDGDIPTGAIEGGTDIMALARGMISITPLQMDMTEHQLIPDLKGWGLEDVLKEV